MIERLLIVNRGEIARRIARTCRGLGIDSVAVFSEADADAAFVQDADLAVPLGGSTPAQSYLDVDAILAAAERTGADAVHPGYGFLAENADFARRVAAAGLTFVGPGPDVIAAMGSKLEAKARMEAAGVPLLPSIDLTGVEPADVIASVEPIGYPLLLKASAGGGGRGMRVIHRAEELEAAAEAAAREATSAFGDGAIYAERYVSPSRHVEVQIFGDHTGRVIHLHERDCSVQRRHQKIIEECPAPWIDEATRAGLHEAAVRAGESIGYTNAGTVEFLVGPPGDDGAGGFFFLEINTRLQVEHPVTEAVLGLDLVELQLSVAAGGTLPPQDSVGRPSGHAIEARLYAEDPAVDYRPSTGVVHAFDVPGDVRVDSAFDPGRGVVGEVSQYYDPMIAKVIAHAPDRDRAARKLSASLRASVIDGIRTNRELLVRTLRHRDFLSGTADSEFLVRHDPVSLSASLLAGTDLAVHAVAGALALQATHRAADRYTPGVASGFRNVATQPQRLIFEHAGEELEVWYRFDRGVLAEAGAGELELDRPLLHAASAEQVDLTVGGVRRQVDVVARAEAVTVRSRSGSATFGRRPRFSEREEGPEAGSTVATMPGTVVAVHVSPGQEVVVGQVLVVMEAMKMELEITASAAGQVASVPVAVGEAVDAGAVLVVIDTPVG